MRVGENEYELTTVPDAGNEIANNDIYFRGLGVLILSTRKSGNWNSSFEPQLLRDMLRENEVTTGEAIRAFKKAYSDHFTPASGIEWRHLWKFIEEERFGEDRKLFTYDEVLDICARENITTDAFEFVDSEYNRYIAENEDINIRAIKVWRRR